MPIYKCRVKKGVNEVAEQRVAAASEKEAIEKLSQMGLLPLRIEEMTQKELAAESTRTSTTSAKSPLGTTGAGAGRRVGAGRRKVQTNEITVFTREMASLFKSGVPILTALEIIREQSENLNFKQMVEEIHDAVKEGSTFSAALEKYPRVFPAIYIAMIKTGENSGALPEVLLSIADYRRKQQEMASRFRMALAYPALMGFVGLGTIIFMFTYVIPRLTKIYVNLGEALPLPTRILLAISDLLRKGWPVILLVLAVGVFIFRRQINTAAGKKAWSQFVLRLPLLGKFIVKAELARFCRTFGLLIRSGVPILSALHIAVPVIENEVIKDQIGQSSKDLEHGGTLGKTLKNSPMVPLFMSNLIRVGEESGKLQDALDEVANSYERDTDEAIRIMSSLLEPLMILVMGLVTGFIVIAMLLPIFDINTMMK